MSKDPNQWSLCCLNMLDRTRCVFVTGVVVVASQGCRWVCYVGCEPTFERDRFLYLFLRLSHDVWLWRDILHENQLMLCIPEMVKENHASINHYGRPTLAPWFVKIAPARNVFIIQKHVDHFVFWPYPVFLTGMWNTFLCWSSFVSENPNTELLLPRWPHPRPMEKPHHMFAPKRGLPKGDFPFFLINCQVLFEIWAGKVLYMYICDMCLDYFRFIYIYTHNYINTFSYIPGSS